MAKVKLQYKTGDMVNPATKQKYTDRRSVHIVNLRIYNIDELVKFALDNNYIEGAKYELAKGILKGAIEAERALLLAGNAVSIDGWVKYEPSLKGSVSADKRMLTKDNSLAVTIRALKELKMSLDTFSWQLADEGFTPSGGDDDGDGGDTPPAPTPPTLTKVYSFQHESDTEHLYDGNSAIMEGTGLNGATVTVQALDGVWGEETAIPAEQLEVTDTKIIVDGQWLADWAVESDIGYTDSVRFHVTTANGTAMIASIWTENA